MAMAIGGRRRAITMRPTARSDPGDPEQLPPDGRPEDQRRDKPDQESGRQHRDPRSPRAGLEPCLEAQGHEHGDRHEDPEDHPEGSVQVLVNEVQAQIEWGTWSTTTWRLAR
jgi:hypothetical protein